MITRYHAKYYACLLSQKAVGDGLSSLSQSLLNATVDINPHQIEAALFAFKSPLSKGVVLADEVGLGKTIEAGLILCQFWSVGKRKIIVICPAAIRKQWGFELLEKFGIDNEILDSKNYNAYIQDGRNPFSNKKVIICSYNFAAKHKGEILQHGFDMAVVDEAHKLRNVYRKSAKTAADVRDALHGVKKLLLTATPFQNSLLELYGLTSIIDNHIFGSEKTFRKEYGSNENLEELRARVQPIFKRTLRKDVREYINYTNRHPLTQQFASTDDEFALYQAISEFLRRNDIYSVPTAQKKLTTMIIRKIMASSTYALIFTLTHIKERLERMLAEQKQVQFSVDEILDGDEFADYDDVEDWEDTSLSEDNEIDLPRLKAEIKTIEGFISKAKTIKEESKFQALIKALDAAFLLQQDNGAPHKALIFTESTKTQSYLKDYLEANGYAGKIVLFNGKASEPQTNEIFSRWCQEHPEKVSGIKAADRRAAIVDYFKNSADIMIATEAASEGLNLQFCSLIINFDLPWNPQRIEQRIGRCHRYGQKHDVVVVNFINTRNYADVRVLDLLSSKFKLFNDVFGASDEVLGQADSIDLESRILDIYQQCRTEQEIKEAFDRLQAEMQEEIDARMGQVREQVLENFDINVQEHLRTTKDETGTFLNRYQHIFWELTKYMLSANAIFNDSNHSFYLKTPVAGCEKGLYEMLNTDTDARPYRLNSPLGQYVVNTALSLSLDDNGSVLFSQDAMSMNATLPDYLQDKEGLMVLSALSVSSMEEEQFSIFSAYTFDGQNLSQEDCEKLFLNGGVELEKHPIGETEISRLLADNKQHSAVRLKEIDSRNLTFFQQEETRIRKWESDMIDDIEQEIITVKRTIRQAERDASNATTLEGKLECERKVDELKRKKRRLRNELDDREDEVGERRKQMLRELESRLVKQSENTPIFIIHWKTQNNI